MREMVAAARGYLRAGRHAEAAKIWNHVLAITPRNSQALFHLGQHYLQSKDPSRAKVLFESAEQVDPKSPIIPFNTSLACRALGDSDNEMQSLVRALALDPYFFPALLCKGALFERMAKSRAAAQVYRDVMLIAPSEEEMSPEFVEPFRHARTVALANAAALEMELKTRIDSVRVRHSSADVARFDDCTDVTLGKKKVYTQHPTLLHFPGLPAVQFYDNADFPWLKKVAAESETFRDEFMAVLREDTGFVPYVRNVPGTPLNQWAELNHSPRWSAFFLFQDGLRQDANCSRCPKTATFLETLPLAQVPRNAPAAFFSVLAPHTRIPPHTGVTNTRLIVHVPLVVPAGCGFRVGNETRDWRLGEAWVFDDTIEHEAWNNSDELRALLIFDIWNPHLNQAERELVGELLNGMSDYYDAE